MSALPSGGSLSAIRSVLFRAVLMLLALSSVAAQAQDKRIALTFDDIPRHAGSFIESEDERTDRIIAALGKHQAAFFLNPDSVAKSKGAEDRIERYVAAGHVIANHTNTHPQLRDTDTATYIADIDAAAAWLNGRAGFRPWFRFPFLDEGGRDKEKRDTLRSALEKRGLTNAYVTVDASDWFYDQAANRALKAGQSIDIDALKALFIESHVQSAEFNYELAKRVLGRDPAHVMLMHETDLVALFLTDLIAALEVNGWTIIAADDAFADPISKIETDVPYAQGTLIESIAWERGIPAPRWYARNDTRIANELFRTRVLGLKAVAQDAPSK